MKPFFSKPLNDWIVDEVCKCGHSKKEHGSLVKKVSNGMLRLAEEGNCCSGHCECLQYTFENYITAEQAVAKVRGVCLN